MNRVNMNFADLPTEILYYILKKLQNVYVLYSLFGIHNQRLESIIRDKIFSNMLNFTSLINNKIIIDRFCNCILPEIRWDVECLIVDPLSIEHVLLAAHSPNLTELKYINFERDKSLDYFTDKSSVGYRLKQQLTKLELVNIDSERTVGSSKLYTKVVYAHLLSYLHKLEYLDVIQTTIVNYPGLSICNLPPNTFSSSYLIYLSINVKTFTDCLCLLDGRLQRLTTLIVEIYLMATDSSIVHNWNDLPNMKCFSLVYYDLIKPNDNKIVSLIRRMIFLEKLILYVRIDGEDQFVNPRSVLNEYSMNMSHLRSFDYYLSTTNNKNDLVDYLSSHKLQESCINRNLESKQISNIVSFSANKGTYHVFTLPFNFSKLTSIGNIFPNLIFNNVIDLLIQDVVPFKHEYFLRISQAFPLLKCLYILDNRPYSYIENKSSEVNQIVNYAHLTSLAITNHGIYYLEQFLNETKTNLPCLTQLRVMYDDLQIVTEDFTRETTRHNCANITRLITYRQTVGSKDFYNYFPLLGS